MYEFSLEEDVTDLSEGDLRETLTEFMQKAEENREEVSELEESLAQFKEENSELESDLDEAMSYFAEKAAPYTNLDEDVLIDRFELDELVGIASDAEEVSVDDDDGSETTFSEKKQKSRNPTGQESETSKRATETLGRLGFSVDN